MPVEEGSSGPRPNMSDFNAVLAALTIAMIPMLLLYVVFNRQFIRGLMGGALK